MKSNIKLCALLAVAITLTGCVSPAVHSLRMECVDGVQASCDALPQGDRYKTPEGRQEAREFGHSVGASVGHYMMTGDANEAVAYSSGANIEDHARFSAAYNSMRPQRPQQRVVIVHDNTLVMPQRSTSISRYISVQPFGDGYLVHE